MTDSAKQRLPIPPIRKGHTQPYEALESYQAQKNDELSFDDGDILFVVERTDSNMWYACLGDEKGFIPSSCVSSENTRAISVDAARRGNVDLLLECLSYGVSVNALDSSGSTALHAASKAGHLLCVHRLLEEDGISIDIQNNVGDTPLHGASYRGHGDIVELLIRKGARKDIRNRNNALAETLAGQSDVALMFVESGKRRSSTFSFNEYGEDDDSD